MLNDDGMWEFSIPGPPVGWQRPGKARSGHRYTPTNTREYEEAVALSAMAARVPLLPHAQITIACRIPVRRTVRKTLPDKLHEPRMRPDLDNVLKAILDGMENTAYGNDRDVLGFSMRWQFITAKNYKPETEVIIRAVDWGEYCEGEEYKGIKKAP